jgi:hypothetical protein
MRIAAASGVIMRDRPVFRRPLINTDRLAIMPKQMHLALDVSWTQVESAWRMPGSWVGRHYPDVGLFEDIARIAAACST